MWPIGTRVKVLDSYPSRSLRGATGTIVERGYAKHLVSKQRLAFYRVRLDGRRPGPRYGFRRKHLHRIEGEEN